MKTTLWSAALTIGVPLVFVCVVRFFPGTYWYIEAISEQGARYAPTIVVKNDSWWAVDDVKLIFNLHHEGGDVFVVMEDEKEPDEPTVLLHGQIWEEITKSAYSSDTVQITAAAKISAKSQVFLQPLGLVNNAGLRPSDKPRLFVGTQEVSPSPGPRQFPEWPWVLALLLGFIIWKLIVRNNDNEIRSLKGQLIAQSTPAAAATAPARMDEKRKELRDARVLRAQDEATQKQDPDPDS